MVWGPTLSMNFATLVPKRDDEVDASRDGKLVYPSIVTLFVVMQMTGRIRWEEKFSGKPAEVKA